MVLSVEAKRRREGNGWEAYVDLGREKTDLDVLKWVERAVVLGAGEILITSVDKEGMQEGFDNELVHAISSVVDVPIIASGGMGNSEHARSVIDDSGADAVAMAHVLHYNKITLHDLRTYLLSKEIEVSIHDVAAPL
jgi:cyclase